ncbi:MAG TPA: hypothetical protein VGK37_16075 [Casimicrobiaceae bacterium]|jgi:serine/threonine protein kinase
MTPQQIERVFGRERLKMATGEHVEVFRESVRPGERRRYTKRFLATSDADFGQWTEREWRILARLIGHGIRCVPDVVQFDGGAMGGIRLVQTYDAGVTVDQWATLLPVSRDGTVHRHVFEDCGHWWALAHYCLAALDEIHPLHVVHLDIKGDNICIPYGPGNFDPDGSDLRLYPVFTKLALIDFAFSLVSRENLATALPIGWQKDYDYQSPRLLTALDAGRKGDLQPTKDLDWRCDLYSLAAMLKRYLPTADPGGETGWTPERYDDARTLIFRLRECHDRDLPHWRPHQQLMDFTAARIGETDLAASLDYGWELARDAASGGAALPITPMTRTAPAIRAFVPASVITPIIVPTAVTVVRGPARVPPPVAPPASRKPRRPMLVPAIVTFAALAAPSYIGNSEQPLGDRAREVAAAMRSMFEPDPSAPAIEESAAPTTLPPQATEPAQPSSADQTSTRVEAPAATVASNGVHAESEARSPSTTSEPKAPSPRTMKARVKQAPPTMRTQRPQNSSQWASTTARPVYPLPRVASIVSPKQSRSASVASASTSGHSSPWQSPPPSQRFPVSPPVEVAAATATPAVADSTSPRAPIATESPASTSGEPARERAAATAEDRGASAAGTLPPGRVEHAQSEPQRLPSARPNQVQRSVQNPQPVHDLRTFFASLGKLLRSREEPPAPVEERRAQPGPPPTGSLRAPPQSAPSLIAQVRPGPSERSEIASIPVPTEELRAQASAPAVRLAPTYAPPPGEARIGAFDGSQDELTMQARRMLADTVPRVAAESQPDVARVLWTAANANHPSQRQAIISAANATWSSESTSIPAANVAPAQARRLYADSRRAFASGHVVDAFNLELKAFGANPRDPDIAGYLAFLHLRMFPAQPETARQLAMHAIVVSGSQRSARPDDWNTLAVASALTGRNVDASRALLVEIALTSDLDWSCQSALNSYASFGERLRSPVQMMLARVRSQGYESPYCAWPPYRSAAAG